MSSRPSKNKKINLTTSDIVDLANLNDQTKAEQ